MKEDAEIDLPSFHPCMVESDENGQAKNKLRLKALTLSLTLSPSISLTPTLTLNP